MNPPLGHLSLVKAMFRNGVNVLSLFTGIAGGEACLHKLGIHMRAVVDVSILDEDDSDDDMMRFKDNEEDAEKLTGIGLISLGHVLPSYQWEPPP